MIPYTLIESKRIKSDAWHPMSTTHNLINSIDLRRIIDSDQHKTIFKVNRKIKEISFIEGKTKKTLIF